MKSNLSSQIRRSFFGLLMAFALVLAMVPLGFTASATEEEPLGEFPTATVTDITISGQVGTPIPTQKLTITLTNTAFAGLTPNKDVSQWFKALPKGLKVTVSDQEEDITDTTVVLLISGTPTQGKSDALQVEIPANAQLPGASTLPALYNQNAQWDISDRPTEVSASVSNVILSGMVNGELDDNSFTITVSGSAFGDMDSGTSCDKWISNLPRGLTATAANTVSQGDTSVTLTVTGTPRESADDALRLTVPASALLPGATSVTVKTNDNARWAILETPAPAPTEAPTPAPTSAPVVTLTQLLIATPPAITTYQEGQSFQREGMKVLGVFSNGHTEEVSGYSYTPNGPLTANDKKITLSYSFQNVTKTCEQAITVEAKSQEAVAKLSDVNIKGRVGEKLGAVDGVLSLQNTGFKAIQAGSDVSAWFNCPAGVSVTVKESGAQNAGTLKLSFSGTPKEAVSQPLKVTIPGSKLTSGKDLTAGANQNAVWSILAAEKNLTSLAVTKAPSKVLYTEGQHFDKSGMEITAYYGDKSKALVTDYSISPTDGLETTTTQVVITYKEGDRTASCTQSIQVKAAAATLSDLKTDGIVGQPLPDTEVLLTLRNTVFRTLKTGEDVTSWFTNIPKGLTVKVKEAVVGKTQLTLIISGTPEESKEELVRVKIPGKHMDSGKDLEVAENYDAAWHMHDAAKELTAITVHTAPLHLEYKPGDFFDPTGMVVHALYNDGSQEEILDYTYAPQGALEKGQTTITLSYTSGTITKTTTLELHLQGSPDNNLGRIVVIVSVAVAVLCLGGMITLLALQYKKKKAASSNKK